MFDWVLNTPQDYLVLSLILLKTNHEESKLKCQLKVSKVRIKSSLPATKSFGKISSINRM